MFGVWAYEAFNFMISRYFDGLWFHCEVRMDILRMTVANLDLKIRHHMKEIPCLCVHYV